MVLTDDDIKRLDDRYVSQDVCIAKHRIIDDKTSKLEVASTRVETKLNMLLGILSCIGAAVVGILIKMLIGG